MPFRQLYYLREGSRAKAVCYILVTKHKMTAEPNLLTISEWLIAHFSTYLLRLSD